MGLEDGTTAAIDAQWFPKIYQEHVLPNNSQQPADSVGNAVRRCLSDAPSRSFAVMGFSRVGLDRGATSPVVVLGVRKSSWDLKMRRRSWLIGLLTR